MAGQPREIALPRPQAVIKGCSITYSRESSPPEEVRISEIDLPYCQMQTGIIIIKVTLWKRRTRLRSQL